MKENYSSINIFDKLKEKYKNDVSENVISISIIQSNEKVCLETILIEELEDGLKKEKVNIINLDCIREYENNDLMFNPIDSIEVNARKFISDMNEFLIICVSKLFNEEACKRINKESNAIGI